MKRFAYLSFGLLCLMLAVAVGFHLGNQAAQAGGPVTDSQGIVYMSSNTLGVIDESSQLWVFGNNQEMLECWIPVNNPCPPPLPVPMSEIKFLHHELGSKRALLITKQNIAWIPRQDCSEWVNCGPWPGVPVETKQESWGGVKGQYGKKGD